MFVPGRHPALSFRVFHPLRGIRPPRTPVQAYLFTVTGSDVYMAVFKFLSSAGGIYFSIYILVPAIS